jgi:outer membrane protein
MLSQSWLLANAKVAQAADARLKQLQQQVQAELGAEQTSIDNDARALESQRASLSPADFQKRQAALQARVQAGRQKSAQRANELAATRQRALERISAEAGPVIAQAFRAHNCSLLIDRNAILLGNMSNDLTAEVVRNLDAKISTITFDRVIQAPPAAAR